MASALTRQHVLGSVLRRTAFPTLASTSRSPAVSSAFTAAALPAAAAATVAPRIVGAISSSRAFSTATADAGSMGGNTTDKAAGGKDEAGDKSKEGEAGSDDRKEKTGEYDTQSQEKRVGNPIAWANPLAGPTIEDNSNPKWGKVYPIGLAMIFFGALYSRRKNLKREKEEALIAESSVNQGNNTMFSKPMRFSAPPSS